MDDPSRYFTVEELATIERAAYRGRGASPALTLRLVERLRINSLEFQRLRAESECGSTQT